MSRADTVTSKTDPVSAVAVSFSPAFKITLFWIISIDVFAGTPAPKSKLATVVPPASVISILTFADEFVLFATWQDRTILTSPADDGAVSNTVSDVVASDAPPLLNVSAICEKVL